MYFIKAFWRKLILLFAFLFVSSQALANCADICAVEHSSCQETTTQQKDTRCDEKLSVCTLSCNREETMSCVYLGFKNHEGTADREKELSKITGGFTRVTVDQSPNFSGLCRSNDMRCEYVLDWDRTMYSCGGEKREPRRVACCR